MTEHIISVLDAFLAAVGACFAQHPTGSFVGMIVAMLFTMLNAKLLKTAD